MERYTAYVLFFEQYRALILGAIAIGCLALIGSAQISDARPPASFDDEMGASSESRTDASPEDIQGFSDVIASFDWHEKTLPADFFRSHYDEFGPEAMITVLDQNQFCHSEAHNLGRVIYERTNDLAGATNICRNQCTSGCIHGVLMGLFAEKSDPAKFADPERHVTIEDLTPTFRAEIASTCIRTEISTHLSLGDCYHAVGHALMVLANYDIPSGIGLCSIFEDFGPGAYYYCVSGAYMERDIEYGAADAAVSYVYPCAENPHAAACFRYKMRRVFDLDAGYEKARATCNALPDAQRRGCLHGVGFGAAKFIYEEPARAESICASDDPTGQMMCLQGAFGFTNIFDRAVAEEACDAFTNDRAICTAASTARNFGLQGYDFNTYLE